MQVRQLITHIPVVKQFTTEGGVRALELACDQKHIIASLEDGRLSILECNL